MDNNEDKISLFGRFRHNLENLLSRRQKRSIESEEEPLKKEDKKATKLNLSPSPKNPQKLSKLYPRPRPVPKIRGGDGENRGSGPRFTRLFTIFIGLYKNMHPSQFSLMRDFFSIPEVKSFKKLSEDIGKN